MFKTLKDYLEKKELSIGEISSAFDLLNSATVGKSLCSCDECGEKEIEDTGVCKPHLRAVLVSKWN